MASGEVRHSSEEESRELAEQSRQADWAGRSFTKELFSGRMHLDWIDPYPDSAESEAFTSFYAQLRDFLEREVDGVAIDREGEYPAHVLSGLARLGAFGMKIDREYGGLGLNQAEYGKALELVAYHDGSLAGLLSAHQSIGVPSPLKHFGTEEQKRKFLPRCAAGGVSAFALTEPDVGSDPGRLATAVERDEDGDYILTGTKLWCTNGTIADLFVVMARHTDTQKISAFVVEAQSAGISVEHRCRFMGLKALANGVIRFEKVKVPKGNLIGGEGMGLKIALTTLNTGRLSLPAACVGTSRNMLGICRTFAAERVQWGAPVGRHEAVAHKLADMAATTYAIETLSHLANELAMREGYDIRLEAAAAKEYTSVRGWEILDDAMQIRGGRGYETEASQRDRGEAPMNVERAMRDSRINRIFEGSSEIMHLFMAREALDTHLKVAWDVINPKSDLGTRFRALPGMLAFYATWYPRTWMGLGTWFRYGRYGSLGKHLRFAERATRRLARNVFHGMAWYGPKLEKKQAFLFHAVDVAMEILVMTAVISRTQRLIERGDADAQAATQLAHLHAANATQRIEASFKALWNNHDAEKYAVGVSVLEGQHTWVEADAPLYTSRPEAATAAAK